MRTNEYYLSLNSGQINSNQANNDQLNSRNEAPNVPERQAW